MYSTINQLGINWRTNYDLV